MKTKKSAKNLLKTLKKIVDQQKPMSKVLYDKSLTIVDLPKSLKTGFKWYYNLFGGNVVRYSILKDLCDIDVDILEPIAKGGNGVIFNLADAGSVIKIFNTLPEKTEDIYKNHIRELFELLDRNIYKCLINVNYPDPNKPQLAYIMKKLTPLKHAIGNYKTNVSVLKCLIQVGLHKINHMHKKGIIHCDLKLDNVMLDVGNEELPQDIPGLLKYLDKNMIVTDYDGCIFQTDKVWNLEKISHDRDFYDFTYAFSHPFFIQAFNDLMETSFDEIRMMRYILMAWSSHVGYPIDHEKINQDVFGPNLNHVFGCGPDGRFKNWSQIKDVELQKHFISCLKFADYYTYCISAIFIFCLANNITIPTPSDDAKLIEKKDHLISFVVGKLQLIARTLQMYHPPLSNPSRPQNGGLCNSSQSMKHQCLYNNDNLKKKKDFSDNTILVKKSGIYGRAIYQIDVTPGTGTYFGGKEDVNDEQIWKNADTELLKSLCNYV